MRFVVTSSSSPSLFHFHWCKRIERTECLVSAPLAMDRLGIVEFYLNFFSFLFRSISSQFHSKRCRMQMKIQCTDTFAEANSLNVKRNCLNYWTNQNAVCDRMNSFKSISFAEHPICITCNQSFVTNHLFTVMLWWAW